MRSVYLAGPITGCSFNEATDWRSAVTRALSPGIQCFSPMDGKQPIGFKEANELVSYEDKVRNPYAAITSRDRNYVKMADALFVNLLGAKKVSIGTVIEIAWADLLMKPIIVAMEDEDNPHEHKMISELCPFICNNLGDALEVLKGVLR